MPASAADQMTYAADWGPWSHESPPNDIRRGVLILRVLSSIICGRHHPLTNALARADMARDDALGAMNEALADAGLEMERLPALRRRQLLSSYAGIITLPRDPVPRRGRPAGHGDRAERKGAAA